MTQAARIAPGTTAQIGRINTLIARVIGLASGTGRPPNLFTTVARHRRLFRPWLRFAGALMPRGSLPRADSELLILRVAHNCRSDYEWRHHERIGLTVGLSAAQIAAVGDRDPSAADFDARQSSLLRAADELHEQRDISDQLWAELGSRLTEVELIELCMLVGHYEMLAMTLNALRVEPDTFGAGGTSRVMRMLGRR
jgi:alkylhydroperoxidase family enzyme